MSHNVETMAYAGEVPWHGLGKSVHWDLTPDQMLHEAELDWQVYKSVLRGDVPTGQIDPFTKQMIMQTRESDKSFLIRDSDWRVLGDVTNDWEPLQNHEAAQFFDEFIRAGDMQMHTAGSLQDGKIVWFLAKVNESFTVFGKDQVDSYLLFTNHHKYGFATDVRFTPIRVVCNNTLSMAMANKGEMQVSVSHRRKFDAEKVKETMGIAHTKLEYYKEAAEFLGSKRYTKLTVEDFFDGVFPSMSKDNKDKQLSRTTSDMLTLLENGSQPGNEFGEGTWWQAFNTVTFMTDHVIGRSRDTRLTSAWYGLNRNRKMKALESALAFAENS